MKTAQALSVRGAKVVATGEVSAVTHVLQKLDAACRVLADAEPAQIGHTEDAAGVFAAAFRLAKRPSRLETPGPSCRSREVLEVLEDREGRCATLVCSQLPVEHWHKWLCSYRLVRKGPSKRGDTQPNNP